jgi:hypothetical protein
MLLYQKQREQNLAPIFDSTVDAINLQAIVPVVNFYLLVTTAAFEQIARHSLAYAFLVVHTNLGLSKARGIVKPVRSFQEFHRNLPSSMANCQLSRARLFARRLQRKLAAGLMLSALSVKWAISTVKMHY